MSALVEKLNKAKEAARPVFYKNMTTLLFPAAILVTAIALYYNYVFAP